MNILFLCTGNSCRSQMAEGWSKQFAPSGCCIESAGIEAHGNNPRAIAMMAEAGVDISGQESTQVTDTMLEATDRVATVRHAQGTLAAGRSGQGRRYGGEVMAVFRATRDEIKARLREENAA